MSGGDSQLGSLTMTVDVAPEYANRTVLILGCGNLLFGDDGFGSATVEYIQKNCSVPEDVYVMDVGTGLNRIIFTLALGEERPEKIIILDAVDLKKKPGEVFEVPVEDLPEDSTRSFSLHLFPTVALLKKLRDTHGVEVTILACQVETVPETVKPGLSEPVRKAVAKAAEIALKLAEIKETAH